MQDGSGQDHAVRPDRLARGAGRRIDCHRVEVAPVVPDRARGLARDCGAGLFMVVPASLATLPGRFGAGDDIPMGGPVAGRSDGAAEALGGSFVNVLVLRTDLSGDPNARQLVGRVRDRCLAACADQDLPFERLATLLDPPRLAELTPPFQVMPLVRTFDAAGLARPGLAVEQVPVGTDTAKFDLTIWLAHDEGGLVGHFDYAIERFDRAGIEAMAGQFVRMPDGRKRPVPTS